MICYVCGSHDCICPRIEPYGERLARGVGLHLVTEAVAQLGQWEAYARALRDAMVAAREADKRAYLTPTLREEATWGVIDAALALEMPGGSDA